MTGSRDSVIRSTPPTDIGAIAGMAELWAETSGDRRVRIAVLDGPVDSAHPSLAGADLARLDTLASRPVDGGAATKHGTFIASVIFGQAASQVRGVSPGCRGLIVPIFTDASVGSVAPCSQLDLARAITLAVEAGAHVLNISAGEFSPSGKAYPLLADAVHRCAEKNVLVVAAAGNEGDNTVHLPGALPSVLAVGAMDASGNPLDFSSWGDAYQGHGLLAPGQLIVGADTGGGTALETGTSCATAIVSGVIGLLLSVQIKQGRSPDVWAVRQALLDTALSCHHAPVDNCRRLLAGRLNIPGALARVAGWKSVDVQRGAEGGSVVMANEVSASAELAGSNTRETAGPDRPGFPPTQGCPGEGRPDTGLTSSGGQVQPSSCGCGCSSGARAQSVYALGVLGYDFGTEARRDSIAQHMEQPANPHDASQVLAYLDRNPWDAPSIIWTLNLESTPIYAVQPDGAFAAETYGRLRQFLREQLAEGVERVSIPGWVRGRVRLMGGQVVPIIHPMPRGMYSWTVQALVQAASGERTAGGAGKDKGLHQQKTEAIGNFLHRIYDEFRNLGMAPEDRARNYAGTNALLAARVFEDAVRAEIELDTIDVARSPICRPESDCWDVKLTFFDPKRTLERARKVYRFTVDVSDPVPVMVGSVGSWFMR